MSLTTTPRSKSEKRVRSNTDSELFGSPHSSYHQNAASSQETEHVFQPHKARLYQLFDLIEKEVDALHAENSALRSRIAALTGGDAEAVVVPVESFASAQESAKTRKGMQMGQKLRTALRGPPTRLVFKVGGDGSRFRLVKRFEGHRDGVWHVASDVTRGVCATASADQCSRVWSLDSGTCLATYSGHGGSVNCVSFASNSDLSSNEITLATASGDESAHIWRVSLGGQTGGAPTASSEEDGEEHTENDQDGSSPTHSDGIRVKAPLLRLTGHTAPVVGCEWLAGGNQLITASWDRSAHIYDVEKGEVLNILSGHEQELNHCSAHPSQRLVVTSSKDSTFRLWDFRETIQSVAVFQGHQDSVTSVGFSSGDKIVSGSDDRTVKVWDLRNMRCAIATIRLSSAVNRLAISQSTGLLALPLDNRHVRIYDLAGNRVQRIPNRRCHSRMVSSVAWLDDNPQMTLLTAGFDPVVCAWKIALGKD